MEDSSLPYGILFFSLLSGTAWDYNQAAGIAQAQLCALLDWAGPKTKNQDFIAYISLSQNHREVQRMSPDSQ